MRKASMEVNPLKGVDRQARQTPSCQKLQLRMFGLSAASGHCTFLMGRKVPLEWVAAQRAVGAWDSLPSLIPDITRTVQKCAAITLEVRCLASAATVYRWACCAVAIAAVCCDKERCRRDGGYPDTSMLLPCTLKQACNGKKFIKAFFSAEAGLYLLATLASASSVSGAAAMDAQLAGARLHLLLAKVCTRLGHAMSSQHHLDLPQLHQR